ncbi:MAG: COQ9 family protein [Geminicoccaceae bacterium]|nr:COQ9 family protein [Geminicoccaceae bacterium]
MTGVDRGEQRDRLLEAALAHVPFDGWSARSLFAGARDLEIDPGLARRLFPRGGDDLLAHLEGWADRQMAAAVEPDELRAMRVRDRIRTLVLARLEVLEPHREAMRRAVAARLMPANALAATGAVWRTVDLIWTLAGDRERDASWFTKRAILAGVWSATFLYWLDDRSLDGESTRAFLERRLDDALRIGALRARFDRLTGVFDRFNPLRRRRGWQAEADEEPLAERDGPAPF